MANRGHRLKHHYSYREVGDFIGVAEGTVRNWCNQGRLRHVKTGEGRKCRVVIPESAVIDFLDEHTVSTARVLASSLDF